VRAPRLSSWAAKMRLPPPAPGRALRLAPAALTSVPLVTAKVGLQVGAVFVSSMAPLLVKPLSTVREAPPSAADTRRREPAAVVTVPLRALLPWATSVPWLARGSVIVLLFKVSVELFVRVPVPLRFTLLRTNAAPVVTLRALLIEESAPIVKEPP